MLPSDGARLESSKHGEVREDKSGWERSIWVNTITNALFRSRNCFSDVYSFV